MNEVHMENEISKIKSKIQWQQMLGLPDSAKHRNATLLMHIFNAVSEELAALPLERRVLSDVTFTSKQVASAAYCSVYRAQQALKFGRELGILQRRRHSHYFALALKKSFHHEM